ncbi:hypothetical protein [Winogradskyella wichelsiae]|uniref:hypothetical protein n=1 Tax=Winogradskyella wichelsiae TaxID=2697007 RepID=UPI003EFA5AD2
MDTLISNPKEQFLLGAGLDVLHFESREWLDTINFWKDEVRFFEDLLRRKETSNKNKPEYENMLINLDKIHSDLFDDLEENIVKHEQLLSDIQLSKNGLSDNDYRQKHIHIHSEMDTFTTDFKTFKSIVFNYIKGLE